MKVGILTFYYNNDNFGGQLQARALVRAVSNIKDVEAEQIPYDYLRSWQKLSYKTRMLKSIGQAFSGGIINGFEYVGSRLKAQKALGDNAGLEDKLKDKLEKRKSAFYEFYTETPHNNEIFDNDTIEKCVSEYDCFICGGDQIWNDWSDWFIYNALDNFCLKFVPPTIQKFSYAPSVPLTKVRPVFIKRLSKNIRKLDAVSVRESSSISVFDKETEKRVLVVADPVLLLNREQWDKESHPVDAHEKYVFCYLLGDGVDTRTAAEKYALKIGCKLVTVPHIVNVNPQDEKFGDIQDFTSGPAEFLSLIRDAEVVVTDSFHATVFSMIYHKPFYVLDRTTKVSGGSMSSRLTDFMVEYKLEEQSITAEQLSMTEVIPQIDYSKSDEIWMHRRSESYAYLKNNLQKKQ